MRHQPSRQDVQAFQAAMNAASQSPRITPSYLRELARRRDQHLANLAA